MPLLSRAFMELEEEPSWWFKESRLIDVLSVPGVTILLSLTVFHNLVAETLPQVSDAMPVLGIGYLGPFQYELEEEPSWWFKESRLIDVLSVPGVTILLSLTVFHNLVAETLPQVSDAMPVLGIGYLGPFQYVE
ncbi:hypothetical protein C0J52_22088 [Blattella germanica]|nr:hypothetical protein C0J52_22088 [Blattella germanica]